MAKNQGQALEKALKHMTEKEADDGAEKAAGEYLIGYAVEEAEGMYTLRMPATCTPAAIRTMTYAGGETGLMNGPGWAGISLFTSTIPLPATPFGMPTR